MKAERKQEQEDQAALDRAYWKAFDRWIGLDRLVVDLEGTFDRENDSFPDAFCKAILDRNEALEALKILEERRLTKHA